MLATKEENMRNAALLAQLQDAATTDMQKQIIQIQFAAQVVDALQLFEPEPVPRSSLTGSMTADNLQDTRRRILAGLRVEPADARASENYALWREAVTLAEANNHTRLKVLIGARTQLANAGDEDLAASAHRIDALLMDRWKIGQAPEFSNNIELDSWCKARARDYSAMPRSWRYL